MSLSLSKVKDEYFKKVFEFNEGISSENQARILVVDKFTTPIVSMNYTQSQLLQHDVILVETIENQAHFSHMKNINCIVYLKPDKESIQHFIRELRKPHFRNYKVFLNNAISKNHLESLAEADEFELITSVIELFQDYLIVNDNLFEICGGPSANTNVIEESNSFISLLLSLRRCPIIKFEPTSLEMKKLSSELIYSINANSNNNLFDDLNDNLKVPPLLLLLDRKNDPITPLISPWTYQSMIHELIEIHGNMVTLKDSNEKVVLSDDLDTFFKDSMYLNYGDLTDKFQKYVEEYKRQTNQSSVSDLKTQNLGELKKMLTKFPEYRKLSNNILKHLNIISEIDHQISANDLWEVGELQQTIISNLENQQSLKASVLELLQKPKVSTVNKLKIILFYTVRFPDAEEIPLLVSKFNDPSLTDPLPTVSQNTLIREFRKKFKYSMTGNNNTTSNLGNIFSQKIKINNLFNNSNKGSTNDNIFMQHTPRLNEILSDLIIDDGQPKQNSVQLSTLVPSSISEKYGANENGSVQDILVCMKGGVTYEEARLVHELNASNDKINIIIGGDSILNSHMWLDKLYDLVNE